jgi:hypothetical protein
LAQICAVMGNERNSRERMDGDLISIFFVMNRCHSPCSVNFTAILERLWSRFVHHSVIRGCAMADPTGLWNINANGFKGTLKINSDGAGNLSGTADIDVGFTDKLVGVWSEPAQEIMFDRVITRGGNTVIQAYTGYLFTTKDPIFMGENPPEPNPNFRMLTGDFSGLNGGGSFPGRPRFGWVARQNI